MPDYTILNLGDVEDVAPKHGMDGIESRFARNPLGLERSGLSYYKMAPDFRLPFGHRHAEQEEVYVVLEGSATLVAGGREYPLEPLRLARVAPGITRKILPGDKGVTVLCIGGIPGAAYTPPAFTEEGAPWR